MQCVSILSAHVQKVIFPSMIGRVFASLVRGQILSRLLVSDLIVLESSDEELIDTTSIMSTTTPATSTFSTTTVFRWWPWSPTPTTRPPFVNLKNSFRVRCLLNRQCASMDKNSHCTLFGRCICNPGYELKATKRGHRCMPRTDNEDDCD